MFVFVQLRHVEDDSTIMWAIGPDSGVIAKQAQFCGEEIEMVVPFEGSNSGEVQCFFYSVIISSSSYPYWSRVRPKPKSKIVSKSI